MSNTFKHKINTKYRLGLVEKVPISIQKFWNRMNFDKGEFIALRAKKREQILDNEMNNQLNYKIMTPENLIIKDGFRTIRIDSYIEYLTKKPTCRITCAEEAEETINLDGEWECSHPEDASFYVNVEQIDQIISKLQEVRSFLQ